MEPTKIIQTQLQSIEQERQLRQKGKKSNTNSEQLQDFCLLKADKKKHNLTFFQRGLRPPLSFCQLLCQMHLNSTFELSKQMEDKFKNKYIYISSSQIQKDKYKRLLCLRYILKKQTLAQQGNNIGGMIKNHRILIGINNMANQVLTFFIFPFKFKEPE